MNRLPHLSLVCALALALAGCDPHLSGNGVLGVEQRTVPPFDEAEISLGIEASITANAATQTLTISGDENLLQYVLTKVENKVLKTELSVINGFDAIHPLRIVAQAITLHAVRAREASLIDVKGAGSTEAGFTFEVGASEGSSVLLQGPGGDRLQVALAGGSSLDAWAYPVTGADVALAGGSRLRVNSTENVTGTAADQSLVEVTGGGTCDALVLSGGATCRLGPP